MTSVDRTMDIAAAQLAIARLPEYTRRFADWWLKEFLGLFPKRVAEFLAGERQTRVAIAIEDERISLELLGRRFETIESVPISHPDNLEEEMETLLRARDLGRKAVQCGLRLPAGRVFSRELLVPAEAAYVLDSIIAQDMARKTPFRVDAVFSDYAIVGHIGGNRVRIAQWIARREDVRNAVAQLNMALDEIAFITFGEANASEFRPVIRLHRAADEGSAWFRKAILAACGIGVFLAAAACSLKYWNQQTALDRLNTEIAITTAKAQQVRGMVDQLQEKKAALLRLRFQRNEAPRLIDIWDEVTRVLPSHSWLTELKVAETTGGRETHVNLSGFSGAAPSLVGVIDHSPMFVDAALSAPVTLDTTEGRERFGLQAKVRRPDFVRGEGR